MLNSRLRAALTLVPQPLEDAVLLREQLVRRFEFDDSAGVENEDAVVVDNSASACTKR